MTCQPIAQSAGTSLDYIIIAVYFVTILGFGTFFGRFSRTTRDFFFSGQRFSWWLIAMSLVATCVGSYSFIKYSAMGYMFGTSSSMSYMNDWLVYSKPWKYSLAALALVGCGLVRSMPGPRPLRIAVAVLSLTGVVALIGSRVQALAWG